MRLVRLLTATSALLTAAACSDRSIGAEESLQEVGAAVDQRFTLAIGDTVMVSGTGMRIALQSVDNDSRCPAGFTCVWQGDAHVTVGVDPAGSAPEVRSVLHTGVEPRSVVVANLRVELVELTPLPHSGVQLKRSDYRATLQVKRAR